MNGKNWEWIGHFRDQMEEREITTEMVEEALAKPDGVTPGEKNRVIYQKIMHGKLLRVVTEGNRLITVYLTSKTKKYMKGEEE